MMGLKFVHETFGMDTRIRRIGYWWRMMGALMYHYWTTDDGRRTTDGRQRKKNKDCLQPLKGSKRRIMTTDNRQLRNKKERKKEDNRTQICADFAEKDGLMKKDFPRPVSYRDGEDKDFI